MRLSWSAHSRRLPESAPTPFSYSRDLIAVLARYDVALGPFSSNEPGRMAGLFFASEQVLPIQGSHLRLNANHECPVWVWGARMSEWGAWWADLKVMIWWMAISVVSGELLALAMREIGFF
jgi:hypothetical protein